ncbi:MAG: hypothetical protein VSS75_015080 [Candidatus Parabeggiatoa sp.]|nr:hypothetical protein [Candidatus Parabeggiatoa sp.]
MGLINKLISFFENKNNECPNVIKEFLNDIVAKNNQIDAIFLLDFNHSILCKSTAKNAEIEQQLHSGIKTITSSPTILQELHNMVSNFGKIAERGELEHGIIQFSDGILILYFLDNAEQSATVGFISANPEGIGRLLKYCKNKIDEISQHV